MLTTTEEALRLLRRDMLEWDLDRRNREAFALQLLADSLQPPTPTQVAQRNHVWDNYERAAE